MALARIPDDASERIVGRYASGAKSRSVYQRRGDVVAEVLWEKSGSPCWAWTLRGGKKHGLEVEWWQNGRVAFTEPWIDGVLHGVARHYDDEGELLLETRYVRGTGIDLWCDLHNRTLSEETRIENGLVRERRWWNPDQRTVHREEQYAVGHEGGRGGIDREWNDGGRLRRGFPQYFVHGERVDKRKYQRAAKNDPTLPRCRLTDSLARRKLPAEYVGQPVHKETRLPKVRALASSIR